MSRYSILKRAIKEKRSVACHYDGTLRLMSPHAIGTKDGKKRVLSWQYAGLSRSGLDDPDHQWRCMIINRIRALTFVEDKWYTGGNHTRPQNCMGKIELEVDD